MVSTYNICIRLCTITVLLVFCTSVFADCDCGYIDEHDPNAQLWTSYWESNFTMMSYHQLADTFRFMVNSVQHPGGDSRMFTRSNVVIDSNGLHLEVTPVLPNGDVPSGGIYTKKSAWGSPARLLFLSTGLLIRVYLKVWISDSAPIILKHSPRMLSELYRRFTCIWTIVMRWVLTNSHLTKA